MTDEDLKQNPNESNTDAVEENDDASLTIIEHPINRPPKPPGPALGPYYQFITTDLEKKQWIGSVLIFRHVSFDRPKIEFTSDVKINYEWEVLYKNLFDMCAYRINLNIELPPGEGDEKILWKIDWGQFSSNGSFHIARYDQKWRGGFFSCNGYDATVPKDMARDLNYDNVWNHLNSIHEETPLHLLLWGGDQSYNDFVIEDVPFLEEWSKMSWDEKWKHDFDDNSRKDAEQYYFNTYAEHWECRPEMKRALSSIPSVMMWDDHDIFDGAGSYPPLLHQSPIMTGLFKLAQKMRLLFQHHTTPEKVREHGLFGYQGHNFLARCGPKLIILGTDGRTERDEKTVQHQKTWDMIFDKLGNDLQDAKHLIVLFPVPFSFVRFRIAESILERLKNLAMRWHNIPLIKETNSVFGLPETYDDLLDEWTHKEHIKERNDALQRFQNLAEKKQIRVTFFSGDVHCCGISRFRTRRAIPLEPVEDSKLTYQIISSAIVNRPPPKQFIQAAHFFGTKWHPIKDTVEQLLDFFQRAPEHGSQLFLKKLLPNRNWCYFEQCGEAISTITTIPEEGFFGLLWFYIMFFLYFIGFGWAFQRGNEETNNNTLHETIDGDSYHQNIETDQQEPESNNLLVRFWLESSEKAQEVPKFSSYDLFIPNLKT
jgi:hypothetical protein